MVSFLVSELIGQPVQSFIETVSTSGTGCLDIPVPVTKRMQSKFVCDFCCIHRIRQVLREGRRVIFSPTRWEAMPASLNRFWSSALKPLKDSQELLELLFQKSPEDYFKVSPSTGKSLKGLAIQSKTCIMEYFSSENRSETADVRNKSSSPSMLTQTCLQSIQGPFHSLSTQEVFSVTAVMI